MESLLEDDFVMVDGVLLVNEEAQDIFLELDNSDDGVVLVTVTAETSAKESISPK